MCPLCCRCFGRCAISLPHTTRVSFAKPTRLRLDFPPLLCLAPPRHFSSPSPSPSPSPPPRLPLLSPPSHRLYKITLLFYPEERFPEGSHLSWGELESTFRETFLPKLSQAVKLELKRLAAAKDVVMDVQNATGGGGDGEDGEEEEEAADDGKKKKKEKDDDDDENDEEEGKRNWKSTAEMKVRMGGERRREDVDEAAVRGLAAGERAGEGRHGLLSFSQHVGYWALEHGVVDL